MSAFLIVLGQYFIANAIFGLGLNIQYGYAGVLNLAYIVFFSLGAYADSLLVLGSPNSVQNQQLAQTYVFGAHLPYPLPVVLAIAITALFAALLSFVLVRGGLRLDIIGLASVAVALAAYYIVGNQTSLLNGWNGLTGIPLPIVISSWSQVDQQALATVLGLAWLAVAYWFTRRCGRGPYGRALRCVRENERAAAALGKNPVLLKRQSFVIGCALAGLAGAVFVQITAVWAPSAWTFPETVSIYAAVMLGGVGNNLGVLVGVAFLDAAVGQGVKLIPQIGTNGNLNAAIEWLVMGVVIIAVIWLRPRGLLAERKSHWDSKLLAAAGVGRGAAAPPATPAVVGSLTAPGGMPAHTHGGTGTEAAQTLGGSVLRCEDIHVSFGGVQAVNGATLALGPRRIVGLVGPNGAGKSTLIDALSGDRKPDRGSVWLGDTEVTGWPTYRLAKAGLVRTYQATVGFPRLTLLDNVMAGLVGHPSEGFVSGVLRRGEASPAEKAGVETALECLDKVGLLDKWDDYAEELSGGQLRLLEVARVMMAKPRVLLLDEPLAGINPAYVELMLRHLQNLRDQGIAMLMVEHELSWVEQVCDEVLVMVGGQLVAHGSMGEIRADATVVEAFLG
jgi:ABC-type branched-subunit amino acid transport system ATPase component/ABC-type branched-subunit amino acid transport system permease subunit